MHLDNQIIAQHRLSSLLFWWNALLAKLKSSDFCTSSSSLSPLSSNLLIPSTNTSFVSSKSFSIRFILSTFSGV